MGEINKSRRQWLKNSLKAAGAVSAVAIGAKAEEVCNTALTLQQPEGPFYPIRDQADKNTDLTQVDGRDKKARGEHIILKGQVQNQNCEPVAGALVEIWQACDTGKYNHPSDPNGAELDPDFQYWGQAVTDEEGNYQFRTIKPGAYPANRSWIRPPHIHMKVGLRGHQELITQVYFSDNAELNAEDRILQSLPVSEQENVTVMFNEEEVPVENPFDEPEMIRVGEFNPMIREL